jgi:CysZ protein
MIRALLLSIGQLGDPRILAIFLKSLAATLLLLAGLGVALWYGAEWLANWLGATGIYSTLAGLAAVLAALALAMLLFRLIAIAVMQVFADDVVIAVESRYYPEALAEARDVALARSIRMGLASTGRLILVNVLLLPVYLLLIVTGIGTPILFLVVNGWLLGRDLGEMVAARHMPQAAMRGWRASTGLQRFLLGLAGTALFMVPILNLAAPILGAAMATHLFHARRRI